MMVAGVRYRPIKAGKYLRRIPGDEPGEIFREDFHAVVIDKLQRAKSITVS
jgi:hypothetical protein